jgi:hypothetical protein
VRRRRTGRGQRRDRRDHANDDNVRDSTHASSVERTYVRPCAVFVSDL